MASWHQEQAMERFRQENPGIVHPLYQPDETKWKCICTGGFASAMLFETEAEAKRYADKTGDTIIPPKGLTLPNLGEKWHWKCDPQTKLVYLGKAGFWHQFAKVDEPKVIWCEVLTSDLGMLVKTDEKAIL